MAQLWLSMNEVEGLYEDKFGHDVDADQDGTKFIVTRGAPPSMAMLLEA